jgi:uncharacterized protein YkvS
MINNTIANTGDQIQFTRYGFVITGKVTRVKDVSVIASVSDSDAIKLKLDTHLTAVSHKHYIIVT